MKLTKQEKETIITFNEQDNYAIIYTHSAKMKNKLKAIKNKNKKMVKIKDVDRDAKSVTCYIPKKLVNLMLPREKKEISQKQRSILTERMKKARSMRNV